MEHILPSRQIADIKNAELSLREAQIAVFNAKRALADKMFEMTEIKEGDILPVTGYSHKGKSIVAEGYQIKYAYGGDWDLSIFGSVIKKDGKPGGNVGHHEVKFKKQQTD